MKIATRMQDAGVKSLLKEKHMYKIINNTKPFQLSSIAIRYKYDDVRVYLYFAALPVCPGCLFRSSSNHLTTIQQKRV